jgi:hypothetical protein
VRRRGGRGPLLLGVTVAAATALDGAAEAQDIEPRAFSNAPVGVNFLVGGYSYTSGGLSSDPAVPVTNAELTMTSGIVGYARVINVFGMSGKIDAYVPYSRLTGDALFRGEQVSARLGQYDNQRIVNLGTNRWSFRPQLGVSKAFGPLTLELTGTASFFTDNTDFLNGSTRSQEPIYAVEGHLIYSIGRGIWLSADATWFTGGQTAIDGSRNDDSQRNWRFGGTVSFPLSPNYSVKLFASRGVAARTRNDYDLVGIALQYRWGGGL